MNTKPRTTHRRQRLVSGSQKAIIAIGTVVAFLSLPGCQGANNKADRAWDADENVLQPAQQDSPGPMTEGFRDGQAEMFPTPDQVTERRLSILHQALQSVKDRDGEYPPALDAILTLNIDDPFIRPQERWLTDGWGQPIRYRRVGSSYELVSAGSDRTFGTRDDIISRPSS